MTALKSVTYIQGWEKSSSMASAKVSPHDKFVAGLTPDEKTLVTLRDELYGGSWEQMLGDLRDRLKGKPYIFKLVNRIQDDIARIEKLNDYEKKHKINLAEYLKKKEAK
jgi:hypothetical protein